MQKITNKQKEEWAQVIILRTIFMDSLEQILKDCKITKQQAKESVEYYIKHEIRKLKRKEQRKLKGQNN